MNRPVVARGALAESRASDPKATLQRRLAADGYLYFRKLFAEDAIGDAYDAALRMCHRLGLVSAPSREHARIRPDLVGKRISDGTLTEILQFGPRFSKTRIFNTIAQDSKLLRLLRTILGGRVVLHPIRHARWARCHLPEEMRPAMKIHQDAHFIGVPAQTYSVWVPMTACPTPFGGLALLSRSHRLGSLQHRSRRAVVPASFRGEWLSSDYEPGDALLFHSHVVHGPLPNRSGDRPRLAFDFRFCRRDLFDDEFLRDPEFGNI